MGIIKAIKLGFDYIKYGEDEKDNEKIRAIDGIDIDVEKGSVIAILGHNGSGKSTLAKHMNALLLPSEGTMWVDGMDTKGEEDVWKIRQKAGMVFQNPDNQIVASVVEEDVGFGPENIGVPTKEIWERVDQALERVGRTEAARCNCRRCCDAAGLHRAGRIHCHAGSERAEGRARHGHGSEPPGGCDSHHDHALHGRGHTC